LFSQGMTPSNKLQFHRVTPTVSPLLPTPGIWQRDHTRARQVNGSSIQSTHFCDLGPTVDIETVRLLLHILIADQSFDALAGHNVVPGVIPVGTLLYHGTSKNEIPKTPEWVAPDPEFSYVFCGKGADPSGCWHLTLVSTRPLKVLYFDGSSSAKMWGGPLDTQDILIWDGIQFNRTWDEDHRIIDLCKWGAKYGLDGFVRCV